MGVPGLKHKFEVRGKVKIGERRDRGAASVDHFLCDDPELAQLFGDKPSTIRIRFPHASVEDSFSTGLEWWTQRRSDKANQLACYTKDGGPDPVALRMEAYLQDGDKPLGPKRGAQNRLPIACPARACPMMKNGRCKPMGRLIFFLDGGRTDAVLELDTKSWNSIERLEPVLAAAGDLRGRVWELSVAFESKGTKRFPVLSIQEVDVNVNTEAEVSKADALLPLLAAVTEGHGEPDRGVDRVRAELAGALDVTNPGWREKPEFIERIREVGPVKAAEGLLKTWELWPA